MVRVARLERAASTSQMWRPTNWATPGYSVPAIISRRRGKSKIFLSVVIPVVKAAFVPFSATGESPANAGAARLCGVSPHPIPDTTTALPNHPRYQLRYTRICTFQRGSMRLQTLKRRTALSAAPVFRDRAQQPRALSDCAGGKPVHFAICVK